MLKSIPPDAESRKERRCRTLMGIIVCYYGMAIIMLGPVIVRRMSMNIDHDKAREVVAQRLKKDEQAMNPTESAALVILDDKTQEHEFGWVFFYDLKAHTDGEMLAGNAPYIVDKTDGLLYVTGTAYELEYYLAEFRRGIKTPA